MSLLADGETQTAKLAIALDLIGLPGSSFVEAGRSKGSVQLTTGAGLDGGWGRNGWKAMQTKHRDPQTHIKAFVGDERSAEVRALIRAMKRGNSRGAKGGRKVDVE